MPGKQSWLAQSAGLAAGSMVRPDSGKRGCEPLTHLYRGLPVLVWGKPRCCFLRVPGCMSSSVSPVSRLLEAPSYSSPPALSVKQSDEVTNNREPQEGLSEEVTLEWGSEGYPGARHLRWGIPGRGCSKCKGPEAEKRLTYKKRKENSVLELGSKAMGVRDEVAERSEEGLTDPMRPFYSENHGNQRGLLSTPVTWPQWA